MNNKTKKRKDSVKSAVNEPEAANDAIEKQTSATETLTRPEKTDISAIVTGCLRLNIREAPAVNAEILTVISEWTEVIVDMNASTDEFYKICTVAGIEGFCAKKFIALQK